MAAWGFHDVLRLWIIIRKSGNSELYKDIHAFSSLTKVDLAELSQAPFINLLNNSQVSQFKFFLDEQVKKGFPTMPTAESVILEHPDVFEASSDKPLQVVMWPPTKQVKQFPIAQGYQDGSLSSLECWVYDENTSGVVIKLKNGCIRLYDRRDLLQF